MTLKTLSMTNFQSFELPLRQQDLPNNVKCTPPPIALSLEFWNKPGDVVRMEFVTVYRGLSMAEAAESLGLPLRNAERLWTFAKTWLREQIRAGGGR